MPLIKSSFGRVRVSAFVPRLRELVSGMSPWRIFEADGFVAIVRGEETMMGQCVPRLSPYLESVTFAIWPFFIRVNNYNLT